MSKQLSTWAGRSRFEYEGSVSQGTRISYGKGWRVYVSPEQYRALLKHFKDAETEMGTSRDNPPPGSVGAWLQENVTKSAIASYVGPILIDEGCAERVPGQPSRIRFV
jgi:choline dehydrogenase-like flavoprotein